MLVMEVCMRKRNQCRYVPQGGGEISKIGTLSMKSFFGEKGNRRVKRYNT